MSTKVIDLLHAVEMVAAAVEQNGHDFVYMPNANGSDRCWYQPRPDEFEADHPAAKSGCLIGTALQIAGVHVGKDETIAADGLNGVLSEVGWFMTEAAGAFFRECQLMQDRGGTWGDALLEGLKQLRRIARDHSDD